MNNEENTYDRCPAKIHINNIKEDVKEMNTAIKKFGEDLLEFKDQIKDLVIKILVGGFLTLGSALIGVVIWAILNMK